MARGPRKLKVKFGSTSLTHYGGVYLLHRFFSRLRLRKLLTREARFLQRNNRYSVGEMLLALLYPMILGLERIETAQLLRQNGVFQYLTGLPSYPEATTLRRFLLRVAPVALPRLRALHDRLLHRMTVRPQAPSRLIFDVDSTVLVVYGHQEQARIGYNPIKRGRPSYHPLLCFEGQSKDFWHGELRPGDAHTASGTVALLTAGFAKIPTGVRSVIVRADKGFYDHKLVEWLEARPREREAGFERIRMGFDATGVKAMELADHFGQTTLLRFSNLVRNPKVDRSEFRFEPPKNADVLGEK